MTKTMEASDSIAKPSNRATEMAVFLKSVLENGMSGKCTFRTYLDKVLSEFLVDAGADTVEMTC